MADWLIHLLIQIGGTAALLAGAGLWLWHKLDKALESYTTAYVSGQAAIDVRIRNLEKLAEEQARLTRTVESIKDEISAQRKSHDNRWAFRKDVYVNLITATSGMLRTSSSIMTEVKLGTVLTESKMLPTDPRVTGHEERFKTAVNEQKTYDELFATYLSLSPLAVAQDVIPLVLSAWEQFKDLRFSSPELIASNTPKRIEILGDLLRKLQVAGRKDLWGESEVEAKPQGRT